MMNRTTAFGLAVLLSALGARAVAEDIPDGYGVFSPSGSVFTTEITVDDNDYFSFPGFPGMVLSVAVKASKGSVLAPELDFIRPGGSVATDEDGMALTAKGSSITGTMTLDASGWWQVRVRGVDLDASPTVVRRSTGKYAITLKYGAPVAPVLPVVTKSFSRSATIATKIDTDDYRFEGYPGETILAVLKIPKTSSLLPAIALFKPDGTQVAGNIVTTKGTTLTLRHTFDRQGTWRIHVIGLEPVQPDPDPTVNTSTTGAYSLSVKFGKVTSVPSLVPDENGQYRFLIPGVGGASLVYKLSYTGNAPQFISLTGPTGEKVAFNGTTDVKSFQIPFGQPIGTYTLTFAAPVSAPTKVGFASKLVLQRPPKGRKATLSAEEPIILNNSINPTAGGSTTQVVIGTNGKLVDPNDNDTDNLKMYLNHIALTGVTLVNSTTIRGTVPSNVPVPLGTYDVVVESTTGQVAVRAGAFEVVERPRALDIDPRVGTGAGGYPVTITGVGFRPGHLGIRIGTSVTPVQILGATDTTVTFEAPPRTAGFYKFGVFDTETQLSGDLDVDLQTAQEKFEYVATAGISRIVPSLTTVLGGDLITIKGSNFTPNDHVYLEKNTPGQYEELTNTYVDPARHQFVSPPRLKGPYNIYVTDAFGQPSPPKTRTLTYFQFTNLSATGAVMPPGSDQWDGITTAIGDFDKDSKDDLFISRVGTSLNSVPNTRVLKNDGTGHFTDVTASVMPDPTNNDDWRADRIWVTDVNLDGYVDILIVTNDSAILPVGRSHVRILLNEVRLSNEADRVFRDRTTTLFPAVRESSPLYGGSSGVVDSWRGLDMWVGDIDKGSSAPPEILITHKETKQELDVGCNPYCASPYSSGYTYGFYWGGSRAFIWDKSKNQGLGKYKFEHNFFPRKSGVRVPVIAPGGITIPICNAQYGKPCVGKFTPFTGKRIAVGDLNADGKPDVAVLSDDPVSKDGVTTSSLQVGINKFNTADGALITDVTSLVADIGGSFQGDTLEIGQPGFPDGNAFGVMVIAKAIAPGGGGVMRFVKFKPPTLPGAVADFEDTSSSVLPATGANDRWQASKIVFRDVDTDGDQDMVFVCNAAPGGVDPAFRVFRNEIVNQKVGVFRETFRGLLTPMVTATEHLEGDTMTVGDVNRDGTFDFILTRASTTLPAPQTRIIITDREKQ